MVRIGEDEQLTTMELHEKDRTRRILALIALRDENEKLLKSLAEKNNGKN